MEHEIDFNYLEIRKKSPEEYGHQKGSLETRELRALSPTPATMKIHPIVPEDLSL